MNAAAYSTWLLLAAWVWPLLLAILAACQPWRWPVILAALPALAAALLVPVDARLNLPWLVLGTELGLNTTGQVFLLLSAVLWLVSCVFVADLMRPGADSFVRRRFNALFLLAMGGQLWAVIGLDLVSFYVGFAIMGLAAYGLIAGDDSAGAQRAGRLYLSMTIAGEVALFAGLAGIAAETASLRPTPADLALVSGPSLALVLGGLGVKAAIVPLHLWLPLAYSAAPLPATAVLASAMIKLAVLGWLRWLPLGAVAWPDWALALTGIGLASAFFGFAVGLTQRDPKAVLAYSSIGKMGFLLLLIGLMLGKPELTGAGVTTLLFYSAHHALTKSGLFLGLGLYRQRDWMTRTWTQRLILLGLVILALGLAGAPLTGGALAKALAKPVLAAYPWAWLDPLLWLITLTGMLLMARFLWLIRPAGNTPATGAAPRPFAWVALLAWGLLLLGILALPWMLDVTSTHVTNAGPAALALAIATLIILLQRRHRNPLAALVGRVPPGDLLPLASRLARALRAAALRLWRGWRCGLDAVARLAARMLKPPSAATQTASGPPLELLLRDWPIAGALWVGIGALLMFLLVAGALP